MDIYKLLLERRNTAKGGIDFKWTKEECEIISDMYNQNKSDYEIARILNCNVNNVHYLRRILNLPKAKIYKSQNELNLSKLELEVLCGTILGDANISKSYIKHPSCRVMFTHCLKQEIYHNFKVNLLINLKSYSSYRSEYDKRTHKTNYSITFSTFSHPEFTKLRNIFYINNKKIIPISFIKENFTELSLALLYMDDGYKASKRSKYICTDCFEKENVEEFIEFLNIKFNLNCRISYSNRILIPYTSYETFNNLIFKYVTDDMKYKL